MVSLDAGGGCQHPIIDCTNLLEASGILQIRHCLEPRSGRPTLYWRRFTQRHRIVHSATPQRVGKRRC
jgi:hypothetical protein